MTDNPETYLEARRKLAEALFEGVKKIRYLPDGYAFAFLNEQAWVSQLTEFILLEQKVSNGVFAFAVIFEAEQRLIWFHWRGNPSIIQREIDTLSQEHNPLGRVTLLKDDPLVSIILATYNERENIVDTIKSIFEHVRPPVEVIVVDDDSPDGTWRMVEELQDRRVKLIRRVDTKGLASAFNRGIIESQGAIVGWMDADMCMPPPLLPDMIAKLEQFDIVIGSRYAPGGVDDRQPTRVRASKLINGLATRVLGYNIKDYDSGFVVLRRSVFNKVSLIPTGYGAYFMEFLYTARRKGLTIYELPYRFTDRAKGVSKSAPNIAAFLWTGMGYVYRIFVARLRRID